MALISTASSDNRVVDTQLSIRYTRRRVYGSWSYASGTSIVTVNSVWEYTRTATKNYRYVGMTGAAATALAAALVDYYTRTTKTSDWDSSEGQFTTIDAGSVPMADVVCQHGDGDMWTVSVSVNEEDTRMSRAATASFASLFALENQRAYDTGADAPTAS